MKIGIMSDSHGDLRRTRRGAELLRDRSVTHVFHCGDIGSQEVLFALAARRNGACDAEVPFILVVVLDSSDSRTTDEDDYQPGRAPPPRARAFGLNPEP